MILYFNSNGVLKEVIDELPNRSGSSLLNKVYAFFENDNIEKATFLSDVTGAVEGAVLTKTTIQLVNRTALTNNEIYIGDSVDLKYFKTFVDYDMFVYTLTNTDLVSGMRTMTIRGFIDDAVLAMGNWIYSVENSILQNPGSITRTQYDYLLSLIASCEGALLVEKITNVTPSSLTLTIENTYFNRQPVEGEYLMFLSSYVDSGVVKSAIILGQVYSVGTSETIINWTSANIIKVSGGSSSISEWESALKPYFKYVSSATQIQCSKEIYFSDDVVLPELSYLKDQFGNSLIDPTSKTSGMTQAVGIDSDGKLWTTPAQASSGVTSIGGASGVITLGSNLSMASNVLSASASATDWESAIKTRLYYDSDENWLNLKGTLHIGINDGVSSSLVINDLSYIQDEDGNDLINPDAKTSTQTQSVGIDSQGKLWTVPASGLEYDEISAPATTYSVAITSYTNSNANAHFYLSFDNGLTWSEITQTTTFTGKTQVKGKLIVTSASSSALLVSLSGGGITGPLFAIIKQAGWTGTEITDNFALDKNITSGTINIPSAISSYTITPTLNYVIGASGNSTSIQENGSALLVFGAISGYTLPDAVSVTGATSVWNKTSGVLNLSNPTGNVTFTITGVAE